MGIEGLLGSGVEGYALVSVGCMKALISWPVSCAAKPKGFMESSCALRFLVVWVGRGLGVFIYLFLLIPFLFFY